MSQLKQKLKSNSKTLGSWITFGHTGIAELMAKAGFDWLAIDLEHSCIDYSKAEEMIRVIDLCGVAPLVRLTSNSPDQIKRVLDAGAHGIIVPMVNSKQDAINAVQSTYYPPIGKRGVGLSRAQGYGSSFKSYKEKMTSNLVVLVQIEHETAVKNIREILTVEGVDGFIIGPYDLTASLGVPGQFDDPRFLNCLKEIETATKEIGKPGGFHIAEPDLGLVQKHYKQGFNLMAYSSDMRVLDTHFRKIRSEI